MGVKHKRKIVLVLGIIISIIIFLIQYKTEGKTKLSGWIIRCCLLIECLLLILTLPPATNMEASFSILWNEHTKKRSPLFRPCRCLHFVGHYVSRVARRRNSVSSISFFNDAIFNGRANPYRNHVTTRQKNSIRKSAEGSSPWWIAYVHAWGKCGRLGRSKRIQWTGCHYLFDDTHLDHCC